MADEEIRTFCLEQHPRLVGAVVLYTGDRQIAEDIAQEALARAVRDWRKVQAMASPGGYVHRIAINLANSHFRRLRIRARALRRHGAGTEGASHDPDSANAVTLRELVQALPRRRRAVVALRFQGGLSLAEIADQLDISVGTVKSQLHRALATLREQLENDDPALEDSHVR